MQEDIEACEDEVEDLAEDIEDQQANLENAESEYEESVAEADEQYEENEAEVEAEAEDLLDQLDAVSPLTTDDAISPDPPEAIVATLLAALGIQAALSYVTAQMAAAAAAAAAEAYAIWQKAAGLLNGIGAPSEVLSPLTFPPTNCLVKPRLKSIR